MNSPIPPGSRGILPSLTLNSYRHADNVQHMNTSKHEAAVVLGSSTSAKKTEAAQKNGAKGGRPVGS